MSSVDALAIIDKVAIFNGGLIADDLEKVDAALKDLLAKGRSLSADLEHALAVATFNGAHLSGTPLRTSLDAFDASLARIAGKAALNEPFGASEQLTAAEPVSGADELPAAHSAIGLRFGLGGLIVNTGTHDGEPAVIIDLATVAGVVGAAAPDVPAETLAPVRLVFPTAAQAQRVADALVNAGAPASVAGDAVAGLPGKWRETAKESVTPVRIGALVNCADELEAALGGTYAPPLVLPEGFVLVPRQFGIPADAWEAAAFSFGGPATGEGEPYMDCTVWIGDCEDDDGKPHHGMHIVCDECPEEGSTTLAEFAAAPHPAAESDQQRKDREYAEANTRG